MLALTINRIFREGLDGYVYSNIRSPLERDHKLFPRPLNAIIDCRNDDPDLGGSGD
jgi:hypothetical protein